jgi:hypothetical protein
MGAVEIDGFHFHEGSPKQRERDEVKNAICRHYNFPLLRLPTTGSGEAAQIRDFLDRLP